jgi:hypothetical protein
MAAKTTKDNHHQRPKDKDSRRKLKEKWNILVESSN